MNDDHDNTLPKKERKDTLSCGILPYKKGTEKCSKRIRGEDAKDANRADQKYLLLRKPNICELVGTTYHEAEP